MDKNNHATSKSGVRMREELSAVDIRILEQIQKDSSLSTSDLADRVGLSQSPCWRRLQRLKDEGYIKGQVAQLDRKKLGLSTMVFAQVKLNAHGRAHFDEFAAAVRAFPEVLECYVLMGPVDFLIRVVATDIEAYERFFFNQLSQLPGVQEVNSTVALSEIKATTALPIT